MGEGLQMGGRELGFEIETKTSGLIKTVESPGVDRTLVVIITKTLPRSRALTKSTSLENVRVASAASLPPQKPAQVSQILFRQLTNAQGTFLR
jgi:hypothetical protein